jgi:hypothetical protein
MIPEHLETRDYSRASCQNPDMQLPPGLAAWLRELEPVFALNCSVQYFKRSETGSGSFHSIP